LQKQAAAVHAEVNKKAVFGCLMTRLLHEQVRKNQAVCFDKWRTTSQIAIYESKLQRAATMVDGMSRFSRGFISLNYLSTVLQKNSQRKVSKAFRKMSGIDRAPQLQIM